MRALQRYTSRSLRSLKVRGESAAPHEHLRRPFSEEMLADRAAASALRASRTRRSQPLRGLPDVDIDDRWDVLALDGLAVDGHPADVGPAAEHVRHLRALPLRRSGRGHALARSGRRRARRPRLRRDKPRTGRVTTSGLGRDRGRARRTSRCRNSRRARGRARVPSPRARASRPASGATSRATRGGRGSREGAPSRPSRVGLQLAPVDDDAEPASSQRAAQFPHSEAAAREAILRVRVDGATTPRRSGRIARALRPIEDEIL